MRVPGLSHAFPQYCFMPYTGLFGEFARPCLPRAQLVQLILAELRQTCL